jgi:hypothetical protein
VDDPDFLGISDPWRSIAWTGMNGSFLVAQIASGKALPDEVVAQIIDRTDGEPLFVEELTKERLGERSAAQERNRYVLDRALPPFAIPTTL